MRLSIIFIKLRTILVLIIYFLFNALTANPQERSLHIDSLPQSREHYLQLMQKPKDFIYILEDTSYKFTIDTVCSPDFKKRYVPFPQIRGQFNKNSHYWAKINFNLGNLESAKLLVRTSGSDIFDVFVPDKKGYIKKKAGHRVPSSKNDELYPGSNMILIELNKDSVQLSGLTSVYIKFYNLYHENPNLYLDILDAKGGIEIITYFLLWERKWNFINGIVVGILWLVFLISLIMYISQKNKDYLLYALYVLFISIYLGPIISTQGLLKNFRAYNFFIHQLVMSAAFYFYFLFMNKINDLKTISPKFNFIVKWIKIIIYLFPILQITLLVFLKQPGIYNNIVIPLGSFLIILILFINIRLLIVNNPLNRIFSIGTFILFCSFLYMALGILFHFPGNYLAFRFGVLGQVLVFAYMLIYKMRQNEELTKKTQKELILQLQENQKLQTKVNRELEDKVKERTAEILSKNEILQNQKHEIEQQRDVLFKQKEEITDSITYAQRIQQAVLSYEDILPSALSEYFILFKPRDIVSGDFYWMKQIKNFIVIVAADCTGHGVPGAFMSMLGISLLNEVVSKSRFDSAGEILNRMRKKVKAALSQKGSAEEQKDGMDMALCILDTESLNLQFAGAYNPLYLIRSSGPDENLFLSEHYKIIKQNGKMLIEVKADRQPIAIHMIENDFTTHELQLQIGDIFYLFSDGFPDQIGGEMNKKFMTKNFKNLLLSIYQLPLASQKDKLDETIESWKKGYNQTDDILIIGLKI